MALVIANMPGRWGNPRKLEDADAAAGGLVLLTNRNVSRSAEQPLDLFAYCANFSRLYSAFAGISANLSAGKYSQA
jgi:ribosome biogenesis protein Tsr3